MTHYFNFHAKNANFAITFFVRKLVFCHSVRFTSLNTNPLRFVGKREAVSLTIDFVT